MNALSTFTLWNRLINENKTTETYSFSHILMEFDVLLLVLVVLSIILGSENDLAD